MSPNGLVIQFTYVAIIFTYACTATLTVCVINDDDDDDDIRTINADFLGTNWSVEIYFSFQR